MEDELKELCKRMRLAYVYDYVIDNHDKEALYPLILESLKYEQHERERAKAHRLIHKAVSARINDWINMNGMMPLDFQGLYLKRN